MPILFDIPPEVLDLIGDLLDKRDVANIVLACKHLLRHFSPLLWKSVILEVWPRKQRISIDQLQARAQWVHSLEFRGFTPSEYYNIVFPNLSVLKLESTFATTDRNGTARDYNWGCLVRHNPTIQHVNLHCPSDLSLNTSEFWAALSTSLHNPKRLKVDGSGARSFSASVQEMFWRAVSKFEEVDYMGFEQIGGGGHNLVDFNRLERLSYTSLDNTSRTRDQLYMFSRCSALTRLRWSHSSGEVPFGEIIRFLKQATWPLLDDLALEKIILQDEYIAEALRLMPPLKHLKLQARHFGPLSFDDLGKRHFETLRSLCMTGCRGFTSRMALEVLQNCSLLEVFEARNIAVIDLVESPQPWICHGLRSLGVCFESELGHPGMDSIVFKQLSRLNHLEDIDLSLMDEPNSRRWGDKVPQWKLNSGLERLSTLPKLRRICFGVGQELEQEEIEWMLEHWRLLESLEGILSMDFETSRRWRTLAGKRGVGC